MGTLTFFNSVLVTSTLQSQSTFATDIDQSRICCMGELVIVHFILLMKKMKQREGD